MNFSIKTQKKPAIPPPVFGLDDVEEEEGDTYFNLDAIARRGSSGSAGGDHPSSTTARGPCLPSEQEIRLDTFMTKGFDLLARDQSSAAFATFQEAAALFPSDPRPCEAQAQVRSAAFNSYIVFQ